MEENIFNNISQYGTIGLIISILIVIIKIKPITLLTASQIELKLYTKERKMFNKSIHFLFYCFLISIIMFIFADVFFTRADLYHIYIQFLLMIILGVSFLIPFVDQELNKRTIFYYIKKENHKKWWSTIIILILLIYFPIISMIPFSYIIGTQVYFEFYDVALPQSERLFIALSSFILYFIFSPLIVFLLNSAFKYIQMPSSSYDAVYIELSMQDEGFEKWYIFHPIDNNLLLLGDEQEKYKCNKFKLIRKKDLYNKVIKRENNFT